MKINRDPYRKKQLSYDKDRRNVVGESGGKAHRAVKRRKVKASRALRRAHTLSDQKMSHLDDAEDFDGFVARIKGRSWQKISDMPLRLFVERRQNRLNR